MPETTEPIVLITELEDLDAHEDRIFGELLRRGAQLEEYERRRRMVTVAELHALKEGLQSLDSAISALQQGVERAEAASAAAPAPKANGSASPPPASDVAQSQTATAPPPEPPSPPTFDELAARIRAHDEEAGQLRSMLRERFAALEQPWQTPAPPARPCPRAAAAASRRSEPTRKPGCGRFA